MDSTNRLSAIGMALALAGVAAQSQAQTTIDVNPGDAWIGYMNVFEIPQHGGGYVFGSGWGTADLCATWAGSVLTLSPNTIGDPDPFWYTPSGGPGSVGNKIMDANMYVETTGTYVNEMLTFQGRVLSNTLVGKVDANGNGWSSVAFIKDFAADYSSFTQVTMALSPGDFSISLFTSANPGHHIQYGFETIGPDVWITDVAPYGNIEVTAVPEPASLVAIGLGLMLLRRRRL
ncbi:MAG: PEP-CTERM sorting domain-containing protein [Armatimonadetes bacterium]|nr:PEP-CTERM sorting domain-containing protein [Armatimonadota bacterium]